MVTFGCQLPTREATPETLRLQAQYAEDLGFDTVWVIDHIVIPRRVRSVYPYAADGVSTFIPDQPLLEPLAALNFLAGCTHRVRLGTSVLIIPYRPPLLTAKQLATLDVLSGGRLILGAGAGWMEEEFQALGLDTFARRGAVTDEYLRLFKALWTEETPVFHGEYVQVADLGFAPKPVQKPHPPIWIGGHTFPALRRAARFGDGWLPLGNLPPAVFTPTALREQIALLRELTRSAGRPEGAVTVSFAGAVSFGAVADADRRPLGGQPEQIAADLCAYRDAGVSDFLLMFTHLQSGVADRLKAMERFVRDVLPLVPREERSRW